MNTEFLITSLIVVLLPGTGVIFTVSTGLTHGAKSSIAAATGCTAGIVPHLCASIFGVAAILHTSAVAFQVFKYLGVLYLAYLAWTMWQESGTIDIDVARPRNLLQTAVRGVLINILNPKLSIFFLAFLPQFVPAGSSDALTRMMLLGAVFMLMTLVVFIGYGILANRVRHFVVNSPRALVMMQRLFAGMFLALGAKLALTER